MFCLYNFLFNRKNLLKLPGILKFSGEHFISKSNVYFNINNNIFKLKSFKKNSYTNFLYLYNGYYYYNFNFLNKFYFKNFLKIIDKLLKKNNFLVLDDDYKFVLPLYNYVYNYRDIYKNKSFFFVDKVCLTYNNWFYFYKLFLSSFNINFLVFLDLNNFIKFFKNFLRFNLPIISIIDENTEFFGFDYFFYSTVLNKNLTKIIVYNYINLVFFNYFTYKNFLLKKTLYNKFFIL